MSRIEKYLSSETRFSLSYKDVSGNRFPPIYRPQPLEIRFCFCLTKRSLLPNFKSIETKVGDFYFFDRINLLSV